MIPDCLRSCSRSSVTFFLLLLGFDFFLGGGPPQELSVVAVGLGYEEPEETVVVVVGEGERSLDITL
jgi:hypothetical protein